MGKPVVIRPDECEHCGAWKGVEVHGQYCPNYIDPRKRTSQEGQPK